MNGERELVSRRVLDALFIVQVVANIVVLALVIGLLFTATRNISELSEQQGKAIQAQNYAQLCAQYDLTIAVRRIGLKLGLPVDNIQPPSLEGVNCEEF